jgi:hypothetical protein
MVIVSLAVGMNGAAALNEIDEVPTRFQVPATGGLNTGRPLVPATGADNVTVTTWSDGTFVAPDAGTVDITDRGRVPAADERPAVPGVEAVRSDAVCWDAAGAWPIR